MNIIYSFNDAYASLAGISILSLLKNNIESDEIKIYIIDSGISKENRNKIQNVVEEFGRSVIYLSMPNFEELTGKRIDVRRWNINVFSKLFLGSILPLDIEKAICIDCDTIICNSISELWNIDMSGYVVAGVNECISKYYRYNLKKKENDYYFNSGMVIINVQAVRKNNYEDAFWGCMQKYGSSLAYLDQDVINAVVPQEKMLLLPLKYNVITPVFCLKQHEFMKVRKSNFYYDQKEYDSARQSPHIIHYTTFFMNELRPWIAGSKHPKVCEFIKYKQMSPWADEKLKEDTRGKKDKIKAYVVKLLPKKLLISVVSFLHGYIVPKKNAKRMKCAIDCK